MTCSSLFRAVAALALAVVVTASRRCTEHCRHGKTGPVPNPVNLDTTGLFQVEIRERRRRHVHRRPAHGKGAARPARPRRDHVVNLRMPEEMARVGFDEAALAKELGINYVHIPMRGTPENPYGPKQLDTFAAAMAAADGKVLLHCTVAWRASHLWAAYLIRERQVPVATALAQTRAINLMDDMRMGTAISSRSKASSATLFPKWATRSGNEPPVTQECTNAGMHERTGRCVVRRFSGASHPCLYFPTRF